MIASERRATATARLAALTACVLALPMLTATPAAGAPADRSTAPVFRMADLLGGGPPAPVGSSSLVRTDRGSSARLATGALTPDHVVTMWWVVFNDPAGCEAGIPGASSCGPQDARAGRGAITIMRAAGRIADRDGEARYGAHARIGDTSGALTGPGLVAPRHAEVILALKSHGPRIPGLVSDQLHTFAGGCADSSDAPPGAPPQLVGPAGPNDCAEIQISVHRSA